MGRPTVISGSEDHSVYVWDVQSRQVLQILRGHCDVVMSVAVHPFKKMIASGALEKDRTVILWEEKEEEMEEMNNDEPNPPGIATS